MRLLLLLLLLLAAPCQIRGSEPVTGIIHGPNHAYMIDAPKGYVLDNRIWADQGIFAVFYREGMAFPESPVVAYTMVQEKAPGGLQKHVDTDMVHTLRGAASARMRRHPSLKTRDGREALVYSVTDVPGVNGEWMAYIDAPTVVILVSVSVRDPRRFEEGRPVLDQLVASVAWFTDQVRYTR